MSIRIEQHGEDVLVWVKAVAGASREEVCGAVGERLKVKVNAPAEGGKANKAICKVLAKALGVKARLVTIDSGKTFAEKIIRIEACTAEVVQRVFC